MEPSFLLGTFTALVDRIVNLEKTKLQDNKVLFNDIAKPLFEEFEPVATRYIEIFRRTKKSLDQGSPAKLRKMINQISEDREEMIMALIKVREMAHRIEDNVNDNKMVVFAVAVKKFFYSATETQHGGTLLKSFLLYLKNTDPNKWDKEQTTKYIDRNLAELEYHWENVIKTYENLKIYSTSPKKYIHKD